MARVGGAACDARGSRYVEVPTTKGASVATEDEFNDAKNDAMLALLKRIEELANANTTTTGYDAMVKTALAFRYIAGGEQPS